MKKVKLTKKNKIIIAVVSVILLVALVVTGAFLLTGGTIKEYVLSGEKVSFEENASTYVASVSDNNGNTVFYNPETAFVAIKKASDGKFLLPMGKVASRDKNSSLLNVTVRDRKGNSYVMNSNANSVAFKSFEITEEKNSLQIKFKLFKDAESAKQGFKKAGFCVEIPVVFTTENGNLKVTVNCGEIKCSSGLYVEKLSLLPGLLSVSDALKGEHFIVPDGSGAIVDLSAEIPEDIKLSLDVFGSDIAKKEQSSGATLPCYALGDDKNLIAVLISDGDALSTIHCNRFKAVGSGNLYSEFTLTAVAGENTAMKIGKQYEGDVSLTLAFATVEKNSYNTLAIVSRDFFIKKGYLSDALKYDFGDLPFFINVIGSEKGNKNVLTSFEDASEIVSLLNSKGVRNIALKYSGALDGGLEGSTVSKTPVLNSLGGSEGLASLCKIANDQRSSVWVDVNVFTGGSAIGNLEGLVKTSLYNKLYQYMGKEPAETIVSDSSILGKNISNSYALSTSVENLNIALNDASFLLFTDGNVNLNRQEMLELTKENVKSLSINSGLMLSEPALWLMGSASAVYSVPQVASLEGNYAITSVPLLQMVIHGSVVYGGEPVNATKGGWNSILKSIEYGAVPSFLFTYEECNDLSYGAYATQTAQYYSKVKSLKAIQGLSMTSHEKLLNGVYKVTYGYNKVVYINYNKSVITVDGLLLSPQDFILV
ncbi:MAG: hypothetical protein J6V78_03360 [Clostridia bacterium]|nr:hypothetical protein [Clostridia bacterium]